MSDQSSSSNSVRLSPDEARMIIKAIEQVEKEEAAEQDHQRTIKPNSEVA